ncbi:hypothetical protein [Streptosporangium roseum]
MGKVLFAPKDDRVGAASGSEDDGARSADLSWLITIASGGTMTMS